MDEQKEMEELRKFKAQREGHEKWGGLIFFILVWVATVMTCISFGRITEMRDDVISLAKRTEEMVKEINAKLPYGCGTDGMIMSLYAECPTN